MSDWRETHRETWCETCRDVHGPSGPHVGETVSPDKAELLREIDRQHRRESIEMDAMTDEDRGGPMSDWRETHREIEILIAEKRGQVELFQSIPDRRPSEDGSTLSLHLKIDRLTREIAILDGALAEIDRLTRRLVEQEAMMAKWAHAHTALVAGYERQLAELCPVCGEPFEMEHLTEHLKAKDEKIGLLEVELQRDINWDDYSRGWDDCIDALKAEGIDAETAIADHTRTILRRTFEEWKEKQK